MTILTFTDRQIGVNLDMNVVDLIAFIAWLYDDKIIAWIKRT